MTWQIYTLISIFLFSLNGLFHRVLMKEDSSDPFAQTIMFYGLGGIFALALSLLHGGFHYQISLAQLPYFAALAVFATVAPVLGFKALKSIESSESSILSSSQRVWALLGAFIFLHESFATNKVLGTTIILVGILVSQWRKTKFVLNSGVAYALLSAFFYAATEIISFYILRDFDPTSFSVYGSLIPVICLIIFRPKTLNKLSYYLKPSRALNISVVSINDILATVCLYYAYQIGRNAAVIGPLMSTQTIVAVILAIIFLKERTSLFKKLFGAVLTAAGAIIILIF